ncbi:MAG: alcohol dehydrogenase catalytic domain-containing protein [SAR202 cluster bacterium]|nr:alcohol dehydrogenase catalytic domain-containing protein [SAR202 cluster bacterium]
MQALLLKQAGDQPVLEVAEVATPSPEPNQALVQVTACGFCHHDRSVMAGVLRRGVVPGVTLGHEISGRVVETGNGVTGLKVGDQVVSILTEACGGCDRCTSGREHRCRKGQGIGHSRNGGFAQYVALSEHSLVKVPDGLDPIGAALLACPIGVALQAVQQTARVTPGETVVVTGAGGGLGSHAVQAAAALGARVLAVTSSPEKDNALRSLGADEVLGTSDLDFAELVMAMTGDEGADVVIDTVGSALFPSTLRSLAQFGRLVLLGEVLGQRVSLNPAEIIFRDAQVLGASGVSRASVEQAAHMVLEGKLRPVVDLELPLEQTLEAYRLVSERKPTGRIVLLPKAE